MTIGRYLLNKINILFLRQSSSLGLLFERQSHLLALLLDSLLEWLEIFHKFDRVAGPEGIFRQSATSWHEGIGGNNDSILLIRYPLSICAPSITTDLKPICASSSMIALVMLQECSMLTLFPMVVESGKASSGTQKADCTVELSPILELDPTRTGLLRPSTTAPKPTQLSWAMKTSPKTVALGATWADLEMAREYSSMLRIFLWRLIGYKKATSLERMDPRRSRSSPASLRVLPRLRLEQQAASCKTPHVNRSKLIFILQYKQQYLIFFTYPTFQH